MLAWPLDEGGTIYGSGFEAAGINYAVYKANDDNANHLTPIML
ncbi:2-5-diamino-6-ribosylamino-4(3H)-pyrimidinone 5'-phosphate reductase [Penicillium hordei]|uniref:2-5-diamino-6-ribosylamino-4(3H)-pyrimidinone 5'-phosphate reductase n=1 Tax=Penicillium hordei TaxID=40994 RepID=A0AAD6DL65_9EURO|nr:2-5-diamino-6-ribosylamino-4(3H)-pyrimidinone 5'-phosphate reductase [Penicillium hordei]KAJ5588454.1 2-5-diamino-6-ribosylamino-4(3H)-pyrimidinone 5'-phosphate reductase [Penicillium hordei]